MPATALASQPTVIPTHRRPAPPHGGRGATVIAGPWGAATATAPSSVRWGAPAPRASRPSRSRPGRPSRTTLRRRRLMALGLCMLAAAGMWLALHAVARALGGGGSPALQPAAAHTWVVQPGDTAWGIALASGAKGDIRPVVDAIEAQTGGHPLTPGERLVLP